MFLNYKEQNQECLQIILISQNTWKLKNSKFHFEFIQINLLCHIDAFLIDLNLFKSFLQLYNQIQINIIFDFDFFMMKLNKQNLINNPTQKSKAIWRVKQNNNAHTITKSDSCLRKTTSLPRYSDNIRNVIKSWQLWYISAQNLFHIFSHLFVRFIYSNGIPLHI